MEDRKKKVTNMIFVMIFFVLLWTVNFAAAISALIPLAVIMAYIYYWENVNHKFFYISLAGVIIWAVFFTFKYLINFDDYSEEQLIKESYYFLPPLMPFATGLFTSWNKLGKFAIIIPIIFTILTVIGLPLFFKYIF